MNTSSQSLLRNAAVVALSVLLALPALALYGRELFVSYGIYDEGLVLYGAQRVLEGAVPYRDFWTLYGPAQFYTLAAWFELFGTSIAVERVWSAAVVALNVGAVGLLLRASPRLAIAGATLAAVWLAGSPMPASPLPVSLALALLGLAALEHARARRSTLELLGAGCLTGLAVLFRPDLGALLCVTATLRLLLFRDRDDSPLRTLAAYLLGVLVPTLPAALLLLGAVPSATLLDVFIVFPTAIFPEQRSLPLPALSWGGLRFYCAPLLLALGLLRSLLRWRSGRPLEPAWCSALLLGTLLIQQASVRSDVNHMLPSMLLAIIVGCWMLEDLAADSPRDTAMKLVSIVALAVMAGGMASSFANPLRELRGAARTTSPSSLPRAAGIAVPAAKQRYETLVRFVRETVPPNEAIFVGNTRHDMLHFNDVIFYFLAERDSATHYHELHPGAATTRPIQQEIVRELAAVNTVVLANIVSDEANASSRSSGVRILDDYLGSHFVEVRRAAGYRVLQRR